MRPGNQGEGENLQQSEALGTELLAKPQQTFSSLLFSLPLSLGQRTLHHRSETLETVILVNPNVDSIVSEVRTKNGLLQWDSPGIFSTSAVLPVLTQAQPKH